MNGTGTQADPYQITTVEEFVKAISLSGCYVKLMNDIDFNNSNYINLDSLVWYCRYFDGQNHKVSNLYTDKGCCFQTESTDNSTNTIENLIIEAVVLNYTTNRCCLFSLGNTTMTFICNNCDFRVKLNNNCPDNINSKFISRLNKTSNNSNYYFNNCIFNLEQYIYDNTANRYLIAAYHEKFYFNYCEFNINLINMATEFSAQPGSSTGSKYAIFADVESGNGRYEFKFCPIFINIYNNIEPSDDGILACLSSVNVFKGYNSYIIIQSKGKYSVPIDINIGVTCTGTCFYDKELSGTLIYNESSLSKTNLYGLTTAQCKDPAYLESIGFFIAY